MFVAALVGALIGLVAFTPLVFGMNLARKTTLTSSFGYANSLLLGVLMSFVILAVSMVVCIAFFREYVFPTVLAEAAALFVAAVVFGVSRMIRR